MDNQEKTQEKPPAGPPHDSPAWPPAANTGSVVAEQHEIVRRVGLLFERADAIEREVAAAGRQCERLTQAVMVNIFSGRLCPKIFEKNSSEFFECIPRIGMTAKAFGEAGGLSLKIIR